MEPKPPVEPPKPPVEPVFDDPNNPPPVFVAVLLFDPKAEPNPVDPVFVLLAPKGDVEFVLVLLPNKPPVAAGLAPNALVELLLAPNPPNEDVLPELLAFPKIPPPVFDDGEELAPNADPVLLLLFEPNADPVLDPNPPKPVLVFERPNMMT